MQITFLQLLQCSSLKNIWSAVQAHCLQADCLGLQGWRVTVLPRAARDTRETISCLNFPSRSPHDQQEVVTECLDISSLFVSRCNGSEKLDVTRKDFAFHSAR